MHRKRHRERLVKGDCRFRGAGPGQDMLQQLPEHVVEEVMRRQHVRDLVCLMTTCSEFLRIGKRSVRWTLLRQRLRLAAPLPKARKLRTDHDVVAKHMLNACSLCLRRTGSPPVCPACRRNDPTGRRYGWAAENFKFHTKSVEFYQTGLASQQLMATSSLGKLREQEDIVRAQRRVFLADAGLHVPPVA